MNIHTRPRVASTAHKRRILRDVCRAVAGLSAAMLLLSITVAFIGGSPAVSAATAEPSPTMAPLTGGSETPFNLTLPSPGACTGDTATGQYLVQGYIVPDSVDPATLTYNDNGPVPLGTGASFRQPLYQSDSQSYTNKPTGIAAPGGPGVISPPEFFFGVFTSSALPAGTYNIGIACTKGTPGPTQLDRFWNVKVTFTADAGDTPGGFTWAVAADQGTTTTTSTSTSTTSTTVDGSTTTTTADGSTTTTATDGSTTTTIEGGSTTTSVAAGGLTGSSTTYGGGSPSSPSVASTVGKLPYTGGSPWTFVVWGLLLLVFGRMAVLLGREPQVKSPRG